MNRYFLTLRPQKLSKFKVLIHARPVRVRGGVHGPELTKRIMLEGIGWGSKQTGLDVISIKLAQVHKEAANKCSKFARGLKSDIIPSRSYVLTNLQHIVEACAEDRIQSVCFERNCTVFNDAHSSHTLSIKIAQKPYI